jgi:hypothetical protein
MTRKVNMTGAGLAMGAGFGTAIGVATGNIGAWLPIGIAMGLLLPAMFGIKTTGCRGSNDSASPRK